jgi:hypothetical protein
VRTKGVALRKREERQCSGGLGEDEERSRIQGEVPRRRHTSTPRDVIAQAQAPKKVVVLTSPKRGSCWSWSWVLEFDEPKKGKFDEPKKGSCWSWSWVVG